MPASTSARRVSQKSNTPASQSSSNDSSRQKGKGIKPTMSPVSVKGVFMLMILYVCKRFVFLNTYVRVAIYMGIVFALSILSDVLPIPQVYLSKHSNIFNRYFVKLAWFWNLTLLVPFVILTSYICCCGKRAKMFKFHISRLIIATFFWYIWTTLFDYIEVKYGLCLNDQISDKRQCLKSGHFWSGFDISGHSFILIYGSLILIEEARVIVQWDNIEEFLRIEDHSRKHVPEVNSNPLKNLSDEELSVLRKSYNELSAYIRALFVLMTLFIFLWDIMLVSTVLYYHIMVEKLLGGLFAIATWFVTYKYWYKKPNSVPSLPGNGIFIYVKEKPTVRR